MRVKCVVLAALGALMLVLPGIAQAQCDDFESLVPDGRIKTVTIPFNGGGTYVRGFFFRGAPGRSYFVQVFRGRFETTQDIFLGGANVSTCPLSNDAAVRDVTDIEPRFFDGSQNNKSFTFTATAAITDTSSPFYLVRIHNTSTTTNTTVDIKVSDSTLFSPRWSTFGGFYTSWGINNTTSASCSYSLKVVSSAGATVATATGSVAAGLTAFRDTRASDLNVAASQAGNVTLTHNCPAGGIQADAFMVNETTTPVSVIAVKFEPVRAGE